MAVGFLWSPHTATRLEKGPPVEEAIFVLLKSHLSISAAHLGPKAPVKRGGHHETRWWSYAGWHPDKSVAITSWRTTVRPSKYTNQLRHVQPTMSSVSFVTYLINIYIYTYCIYIYTYCIYIYILYITELNSTVECPPKIGAASEPKSFVAERKSVHLGPSQMGAFCRVRFRMVSGDVYNVWVMEWFIYTCVYIYTYYIYIYHYIS